MLHFHFLLPPSWLILFFKMSRNVTSQEQLQIISLLHFSKVWWFSGKALLNHMFFSLEEVRCHTAKERPPMGCVLWIQPWLVVGIHCRGWNRMRFKVPSDPSRSDPVSCSRTPASPRASAGCAAVVADGQGMSQHDAALQ